MNFAISRSSRWTPGLSISRILTREGAAVPGGRNCRDLTPAPRVDQIFNICYSGLAGIADLVMLHRWAGATALHGVLSANGGTGADLPFLCSVVVNRCLILSPGFLIVAALAQRPPVAAVPEQFLIPTVRDHMIHHGCLHILALLHTLLTQWVCLQELFTGLTPCSVITTTGSGPHLLWVQRFMGFTVFGPG